MKRFLNKPIILVIALAIAAGIGAWRWSLRSNPKQSFRTAVVRRGDVAASISSTGTIEPEEVVDVGAQVAGLITSFGKDKNGKSIDYGSVVGEGCVLAKIDESVYASDVALAKAQLEQDKAAEISAEGNLEQMKARAVQAAADWKRAQELGPSEALASTLYDSYKATYEIANANVTMAQGAIGQAKATTVQAQATLEKAQRNLDFCTITSPVDGVIIDRRVNIGQTVVSSLNTPSLFLIAKDLTRMQIWVSVNEADVGRIVSGTPVTFACDAFPGREFKGTVGKVRLNAIMTQNVVMYTVEVNTANPDRVLLPYLTANVHFVTKTQTNALLVPNAALRWEPSLLAQILPEFRAQNPIDPPQKVVPDGPRPARQTKEAKEHPGTVWLKDGEFVRPLEVKLGTTDGTATAVTTDTLQEGQEVVVGEETDSTQSGTQNPFLPQIRRR
jgi:HlyD family secretion protein